MAEKVRVWNPGGEGWLNTQCEINGKHVDRVKSVDFHVAVGEVPMFTFEVCGPPDIEMLGDVRFRFTPETIQEAAKIICKEFYPGSDYFAAMMVSVEERLRASIHEKGDEFRKMLAEDITRQIVGYPYKDITTIADKKRKFSKE